MNDLTDRAAREVPIIRNRLALLVGALESRFQEPIPCDRTRDNFGFMALCYTSKQLQHARSIMKLDGDIDAVLIARSMLEGFCQLVWAASDSKERGGWWYRFPWILDWRRMQEAVAAGETVPPDKQSEIEQAVSGFGSDFHTRKARAAKLEGKPLPTDPFWKNWSGLTERKIFEEVSAHRQYLLVYRPFSDWHHWSPRGFGVAIRITEEGATFSPHTITLIASAFSCAFQAVWEKASVLDRHFTLGLDSILEEAKRDYLSELNAAVEPAASKE